MEGDACCFENWTIAGGDGLALLDIRNLNIRFSSSANKGTRKKAECAPFHAVSDLNLQVQEGEIVCLVGESGSGKSVSAMSILGLLAGTGRVEGEILFSGKNLLSLTEREMDEVRGRGIAMIFQDIMYSLNPVLTIGFQMVEGLRRHMRMGEGDARKRAMQLLEKTGLPDPQQVMRKYPHQLYGGQRQRVMIAMALTCSPKLLIADEPTTALDVTIQLQIMELIRSLRDETGMGVLLITHDIGVVAEMADRVYVMYAGQCVEEGSVEKVLGHPSHPYTLALMQSVPAIHQSRDRSLFSIDGAVPERYDLLPGCRFATRCPKRASCPYTADDTLYETSGGHVRCRLSAQTGGGAA